MKKLLPLLLLLFTCLAAKAQQTSFIMGTVTDDKGGTLPGATVFLTNTKHITATDNSGKFVISALDAGNYEVVIKMLGFLPFIEKVTLAGKDITINAKLKDDIRLLNEVVINTSDPNRGKYVKLFTQNFIGDATNADQCKVLNPEVLKFHYDKNTGILKARTDKLLAIENKGLGYKLNYLLTDFQFDQKNLTFSYTGYPYFEELKGNDSQKRKWQASRVLAYAGSMNHFFKTVYNNTAEAEGFAVYAMTDKLANSLHPVATQVQASSLFTFAGQGFKTLKPAYNLHSPADTTALFVFYRNGSMPYAFIKSGMFLQSSVRSFNRGQLSKLEPLVDGIEVDNNGRVNPQQGFLASGYWAWTKISELMPIDFQPGGQATPATPDELTATKQLDQTLGSLEKHATINPAEKIYLQLNKPWYNRADTIWFKAYIVTGSQHQLTTLSNVAYAELINPKDNILQKLNLKLSSGMAAGDFALPITLAPGTYRIRAYTNWMKNNDEDSFYDRQIIIGSPLSTSFTIKKDTKKPAAATQPDIQFFPEGGELVSGLRNVVAFKAINPDGSAATVTGTVTTADGMVLAELESTHAGMGLFALIPQDGQIYTAKLQFANGRVQTVSLPAVVSSGYTLTVNNHETDTLLVKIAANPALFKADKGKGFYLVAQNNGKVFYTTQGTLDEATYGVRISKDHFPTGIARITLFSETGEPLNERVVFVQQPDNLDLKAGTDKPTYASTDKVNLNISGTFSNQPVVGSFSAAVTNEDKAPADENTEPTIFSQLLLSSELHGRINDPGYYFNHQDEQTQKDLDLLMLTQGYRKLEWKKMLDTTQKQPEYLAEDGLNVSGTVETLSGKPVSSGKISLISPQLFLKADTLTDSKGHFNLTGINIEDNAPVLLKAVNGKSNDVKITLDPPEAKASPRVVYAPIDTTSNQWSPALKNSYREEEEQYTKAKGRILKEVIIKERYDPAKGKPDLTGSTNRNGPGKADQVIMGKRLTEMGCPFVEKCIMSLIQVQQRTISRNPPTLYIDGTVGTWENISADDIYSVEILYTAQYKGLYGSDGGGGIILITTKHGIAKNEKIPFQKAPGLLTFKFNGYYKTRTFYTPKYDTGTLINQPSAVYWKPDILTDKDGKCSLQYINAGKGNYRVIVEGIDGQGRLGRAVYRYKVE